MTRAEQSVAQQILSESENRLRLMADSLPALIAYVDSEQRYRFNNKAYEEWFGLSPAEISGRHIQEVLGPALYEEIRGHVESALLGQKVKFEVEIPRTGEAHFFEVSLVPRQEADAPVLGFYVLGNNVTARKRSDIARDRRLEFERLISEISATFVNIPFCDVDMRINDALELVGRFIDVDEIFVLQFKHEKEESGVTHGWFKSGEARELEFEASEFAARFPIVGRRILDNQITAVECVDELPAAAVNERQYLDRIGLQSAVVIPLTAGGETMGAFFAQTLHRSREWPEDLVNRLKLVSEIFANALARKDISFRLVESEERFRAFMDNIPAAVYIKDENDVHLYANPLVLSVLGKKSEEFVGATTLDLHPPEVAARLIELDRNVLNENIARVAEELLVQGPGDPRWFRDIKFPIKLNSGKRLLGGIAVDITERKQALDAVTEQLGFERLIADIAAQLSQTKPEELQETLDRTLSSLGTFLNTERAFLGQFTEDYKSLLVTNVWASEGISLKSSIFESDLATEVPHLARIIRNKEILNPGPGLSGLPDEMRHRLEQDGINSGIVVPVCVEDKSIGLLGLDTVIQPREYPQVIVDRLIIVANMIGTLLRRVKAQAKLKDYLIQVSRLKAQLEQENIYLRKEIEVNHRHKDIVGDSKAMKDALHRAEQVTATGSNVLLLGETGTGKELLARSIHNLSNRKGRSLVTVNCAALPPTLIESELFGREKGAFTGALSKQVGRFEVADGSTIFLDEIGDLSMDLQVKLLRVLEEGEFERLGSTQTRKVDVRVIAATNRDLAQMIQDGEFREDLFYRLNVFPITIPPLRERTDDIPLLVWAFVEEFGAKMGKTIDQIARKDMERLHLYAWPGNVRELRNVIERAMILARGSKLRIDLPKQSETINDMQAGTLAEIEKGYILQVLGKTNWRIRGQHGAAQTLGLKPTTLHSRMQKLGIKRPLNPDIP